MQYSLAIYGSIARNDYDQYSDKDLLLVSNEKKESFDRIVRCFSKSGWNCTHYSFDEIIQLANKGALFLQHVKQESKILLDNFNNLSKILNDFNVKKTYTHELTLAKQFFNILYFVENSPLGIYWALDVISTALRNYQILFNAEQNLYEFSFNKLINISQHQYGLTQNEVEILLSLRQYKYEFRTRNINYNISSDILFNVVNILNNKIMLDIDINIIKPEQFFNKQLTYLNKGFLTGYQQLRLVESLFFNIKNLLPHSKQKYYSDIFCNPRKCHYTFNSEIFVSQLLLDAF